MALPAVDNAVYPTPEQLLNQILSDIRYAFARAGIVANVEEGSDHWIRAKAYANRLSIAFQNNKLALQDISPLTATGEALETFAGVFGVTRRAAGKATGFLIVDCTGSVTIPAGYQCASPGGETYKTITVATVSSGDTVEIIADDAGEESNLDPSTIVIWLNGSVGGLKPTATVDSGGIDGGEPEDDDERLRARLIRRLAFPGVGGNWAQIAQWAEESSSSIEAAFVYPAVRGPGSYDVAVTASGGDRSLSATVVSNVEAYITARMPGHADLNITSVNGQLVDVIINMTLPLPASAGGAGGGWIDNAPWPSTADAVLAKVTNVASNVFTVNSTSADPPVAGKHFGVWDPDSESMRSFVIQSVGGSSGAYTVTVDTAQSDPITTVLVGMYVSAGAVNLATYADEFANLIDLLGPGEKTTSTDILPIGRRQPGPDVDWPAALTTVQLGTISREHPEVLDISYAARYEGGTTTPLTGPSVTTTTADAPRILLLNHLAFRRTV